MNHITLAYVYNKKFFGNDNPEMTNMFNQHIDHVKSSEFDLFSFMHESGLWFGTSDESFKKDTNACTLTISKYGWKLETRNTACLDMYPACSIACGPGNPPDEVVQAGFPTVRR